jgi:hypothetical protein
MLINKLTPGYLIIGLLVAIVAYFGIINIVKKYIICIIVDDRNCDRNGDLYIP